MYDLANEFAPFVEVELKDGSPMERPMDFLGCRHAMLYCIQNLDTFGCRMLIYTLPGTNMEVEFTTCL